MKIIILAAGQGTRLRPLTDDRPKCMVEINGISIIDRQIATMKACGVEEEDIYIVSGYRADILAKHFSKSKIHFIINREYESTNMVCSLLCAKTIMETEEDVIVSYGDIIYEEKTLKKVMEAEDDISIVVDDGWYHYWAERCENPLDDAETLMYDDNDNLIEIGQKTDDLSKVQSQYIGLMHYKRNGIRKVLNLAKEAEERSANGTALWSTNRNYQKMYLTDLLQGLIENGNFLKAIHIDRGWYEVDSYEDLQVVEKLLSF